MGQRGFSANISNCCSLTQVVIPSQKEKGGAAAYGYKKD